MSDRHALTYRPDIDGLRAIAVLSVVLYHFGVPGLNGGFVGVDVFFVISGFLIGGLLWREVEDTGSIRLGHFFARRIKRLAPAFVVMSLICAAVGYVYLLPFEYREFGKSLIAATVYLSNVHFFREAGYFDTGAEDKILLHTWSLAVEEQFYIALPLIMLVLAKRLGPLRTVLWLAFFASLTASVWMTPRSQTAAFYLFPFRAWEMLAGVLLAVEAHRRSATYQGPAVLSYLGLALTITAILIVPAGASFPGVWALLPVLGTVLLLANGRAENGVNTLLRTPEAVGIGLISYSLYLWHWPVFTLSSYVRGPDGPAWETAGWIALSFALAYLSWKYVEGPLRRTDWRRTRVYLTGAVASAVLLGIGGVIFVRDGMIDRFGPPLRTHIEASADFLQDWSRCQTPSDGTFKGLEVCPIGPSAPIDQIDTLIWGDSHVRALKEGLEQLAYETDTPALLIWRAGCAPVFGLIKSETSATHAQNAACTYANDRIETALSARTFTRVLLVGRWAYYTNGGGIGLDAGNRITLSVTDQSGTAQNQLTGGLQNTVATLQSNGSRVFLLAPIPEIEAYDSRQIARALAGRRLAEGDLREHVMVPLSDVQLRQTSAKTALKKVQDQTGVIVIDPSSLLCDAQTCRAIHQGTGQYFDNNHLTNAAARRIRTLFAPVFGETTP